MAPPLHCSVFFLVRRLHIRTFEVCLSPSDVVSPWLKFQTKTDCIPQHPYYMYVNYLAPCYAVDWHMGPSLHCYAFVQVGRWSWILGNLGCIWSEWYCKVRSWGSKQTETVSHSIHIICKHTKCFSTLPWCGWAYGSILTLLHMCSWGCIMKLGCVWLSLCDDVRSCLGLFTSTDCVPHPYHIS